MPSTLPEAFIIEHDTRGVLVDIEPADDAKGPLVHLGWRARFSASKLRSQGARYGSAADARMAWSRLDPRIRRGAHVRRWGSWSIVDPASL